jgi:hypothetical protein
MDSGLDAWKKRAGAATGVTLRGLRLNLRDGSTFSLEDYRRASAGVTEWMAKRSASMVDLIRSVSAPGTSQRTKAKLTAKSYILQEAEAASRAAKIRWCRAEGIEVSSLQHDGIMMGGIRESDEARVAAGLSQAATAACGYEVVVVVKSVKEVSVEAEVVD